MTELFEIQQKLKAPKDKYNKFGGYAYRSCEGILEAVKPILSELGCTITINDEIIQVGNSLFVKATATLTNKDGKTFSTNAYARHDETKKGMDGAQITGATSSYARKYALNGLFAIDDNKDADTEENHNEQKAASAQKGASNEIVLNALLQKVEKCTTKEELTDLYKSNPDFQTDEKFRAALNAKYQKVA